MANSLQSQLKKKHPFEIPEEEVHLNIMRTYSVIMGPSQNLFKEHNLSSPLYNILRILRGVGPEGLPCSQIGERMVTRVPDVTRLVDRLEKSGWVTRDRCTEDRRVVTIKITKTGKEMLDGLDEPITKRLREVLGHLTKKEMSDLNRLLVKARQPHE